MQRVNIWTLDRLMNKNVDIYISTHGVVLK